MAVNKAKRSIHLAQPQPQHRSPKPARPSLHPEPAELMPVRAHVYRTIADMNGGLEHAIEGLQMLQKINYLRSDTLNGMHDLICRIRAQANQHLITALNEREMANASHFQRLGLEPDKPAGR
jgi:hypothetical protein